MATRSPLRPGDALVVVDAQNDFLAGGAWAISQGDEIIAVLNDVIAAFARQGLPVFFTRDWHPEDHVSFLAGPRHCVAHSHGAAFPAPLDVPPLAVTVSKGTHARDANESAFATTNLEEQLRARDVRRLFIGGLRTELGVRHTVIDALARGFKVALLRDALAAVDPAGPGRTDAEREMMERGAMGVTRTDLQPANPSTSGLLMDHAGLTTLRACVAAKMEEVAVFEFFVRELPDGWNFLLAAGLEQALDFLEGLRFSPLELDWLGSVAGFEPAVVRRLGDFRFTGDVHAMPEGTVFFPNEPILRVTAPIAEAQLVETRIVNLLHFQTLIASKAIRSVLAAPAKTLVECGARRAHGAEASLLAARACFIAGFAATSNVLAAEQFDLPLAGTMTHSFVAACDTEEEAFLRFARANRGDVVLLLDTYDTEAAARTVVRIAPQLQPEGIAVKGVRLDRGDRAERARRVRRILDEGGLTRVPIFASGDLDELELQRLAGDPIDGYGVAPAGAPHLDCAYKLQAYAGRACCQHAEHEATWPGPKQVYRHFHPDGSMSHDVVAGSGESRHGLPLLERVMHRGHRDRASPSLREIAGRARQQLELLPRPVHGLISASRYPVVMSQVLEALARQHGPAPIRGATGARPDPKAPHHLGFLSRIYTDAAPVAEEDGGLEDERR